MDSPIYKWVAGGLGLALLALASSYFSLVFARPSVSEDQVRAIIEREYKPTVSQTYDGVTELKAEVIELRKQVGELKEQNAAINANIQILLKK